MSSFNQRECLGCGQPCDGLYCYLCTCQQCGVSLTNRICLYCTYRDGKPLTCCECEGPLRGEFCWFCDLRAETSFAYDQNLNSFDDSQNLFDYPSQPQCEIYPCELCGNDSHYGYDCPPRFPLDNEQEPCYNQKYNENYYPHNSLSFLCCDNCGGPYESFQCQPMNQNYFEPNPCYDSKPFGFDQPPQYHQPLRIQENLFQEKMNGFLTTMQSFCEKLLQQQQAANIDQRPLHEMSLKEMEDLKQHYLDEIRECEDTIHELKGKFNGMSIEINKSRERQYLEHVANLSAISSQRFNSFCYDDDDDYDYKESTLLLNEINFQIPPSIVITTSHPVLPTEDPEVSRIMGNEELNTIPEKESDEFIKSSVEDLVPIPNESEDTSGSESVCILPSCDDFSPIDVLEEKAVTFSKPLFNSNDDFISSDDESLSDEDVPRDNVKIYSNPLFEFDDEYISSDINPLFDEVLEDIECKDSYDPILDESTLLVIHLSDANKDECFDSGGNDDEINVLDCEDGYYDSEGDILYLESLLNDDLVHRDPSIPAMSVAFILEGIVNEPPLEENDDLFDLESKKNDEWKKILYVVQIDDLMSEDKIFDPGIHDQNFSQTYVSLPFEDRHYLFFTYVVRIFFPRFIYPVVSLFLISSGSEDTIFDPGIFSFHFSHRCETFISFNVYPNILNESSMENFSSTYFTPNITMIWGESS
nr:hypothetical protein [Tanacetum cinerariifolium]